MVTATKMPFDPQDDLDKYADVIKDAPKARATRTTAPKAPVRSAPTVSLNEIRQSLEDLYTLSGGMLSAYPNPKLAFVGSSIASNAEQCAKSIVEAAEKDPKLKRALIKMMTAGAYTGVIMAHMPILMAVYMAVTAPPAAFADTDVPQTESEPVNSTEPLFRVS